MLLLVWWILFMVLISLLPFFFSSRRRHTRCLSDWSSDVCSSDLELRAISRRRGAGHRGLHHPSRRTSETLVTDTVRRTQLSLPGPRSKALFDAEAMRSEERRVGKSVGCGGGQRRSEQDKE